MKWVRCTQNVQETASLGTSPSSEGTNVTYNHDILHQFMEWANTRVPEKISGPIDIIDGQVALSSGNLRSILNCVQSLESRSRNNENQLIQGLQKTLENQNILFDGMKAMEQNVNFHFSELNRQVVNDLRILEGRLIHAESRVKTLEDKNQVNYETTTSCIETLARIRENLKLNKAPNDRMATPRMKCLLACRRG